MVGKACSLLELELTSAGAHQFPDAVQDQLNDLSANGVVAAGIVVCRILLPRDQLVGVEELPVGAGTDLVWERPGAKQTLLGSILEVVTWWGDSTPSACPNC